MIAIPKPENAEVMKSEADKYSGCIIYGIALYIDKWIEEDWLSCGLVMRYGLLHI